MQAGLKPKQQKFIDAFRSGRFTYMVAAGSAGSGKTILDLGILHLLCCNMSGLRFAVIRKTEKNLKQTTIPSYKKMKALTRSDGDSVIVDMVARYPNTGSEIVFVWADIAKDPELNNIRGLELTGALIEEANQIDPKYFHLLKTRIGRWNNEKCKQFILLNLNPSIGWCKDLFYDKWCDGTLPSNAYFEEFWVHDNDSLSVDYVQGLEDLPDEEYKRFVKNRWDYSDIPNQLIKYEWYKQCILDEYTIGKTDRCILAVDPAWEGNDATGLGRMHGSHIGWWEEYPKQDPDFTGDLAAARADEFHIADNDIIVDPVGLGAATVLRLRNHLKIEPDLYYSGAPAEDTDGILAIFNKRSEAHWLLREALRKQEITIQHHPSFQKQALAIKYTIDEKKIRIAGKKDIKKEIHESPTYVDLATMLVHKHFTTESGLAKQLLDRQTSNFVGAQLFGRAQRERNQIIQKQKFDV